MSFLDMLSIKLFWKGTNPMIRFICVAIFLVVFLILSIPVFFVEWLIGKKNRETRDFFPADCPVGISLYPADRWRRDYSDRP